MTTVAVLQRGFVSPKLAPAVRAPLSCPGRASVSERRARDPGVTRQNRWIVEASRRVAPRSRVSLRSPGTRVCEVAARKANRWPYPDSRCQTAQCCSFPRRVAAPGFVRLFAGAFTFASAGEPTGVWRQRPSRQQRFRPPMRGDGAPTGALFLSVAPATRDHPVPGRPGPLSALHRGGFRMRTHEAGSRQWDRSPQRLPAPSVNAWRSGSGPPCGAVRAASAGRHSWLRLAGSFLENAPSEPGCKSIYYKLSA